MTAGVLVHTTSKKRMILDTEYVSECMPKLSITEMYSGYISCFIFSYLLHRLPMNNSTRKASTTDLVTELRLNICPNYQLLNNKTE